MKTVKITTETKTIYIRFILLIPILLLLLTACGKEKTTGPVDIRWDREICARCAMAISDRKYSAEVRGGRKGKKAKVYKFDDLGCAVIWLDKQKWKNDPRTEIWVNDYHNGKWINAKTAWYVKMNNTPMDYGMGAQTEKVEGALNFEQAREHIYKIEQRFNPHTGLPRDIQEIKSARTTEQNPEQKTAQKTEQKIKPQIETEKKAENEVVKKAEGKNNK